MSSDTVAVMAAAGGVRWSGHSKLHNAGDEAPSDVECCNCSVRLQLTQAGVTLLPMY